MKLNVIFMTILVGTGLLTAQSDYDKHVFFDNSLTDSSYYYSYGEFSSLSYISLVDGKIPVEMKHFFSPPNSLKLNWKSKSKFEEYCKPDTLQ
ncbi:MAG: hypothetical protein P8048_08990 [Calditrichia bacterium]